MENPLYNDGWNDGQRQSDGCSLLGYTNELDEYDMGYVDGWNTLTEEMERRSLAIGRD